MKYRSELANLTMADLVGLDQARQCLRAVYETIGSTSQQGKPASLGLLDQADDLIEAVIRKGARRACKLGLAGAYERKHLNPEFIGRLAELANLPPADDGAAGGSNAEIAAAGATSALERE